MMRKCTFYAIPINVNILKGTHLTCPKYAVQKVFFSNFTNKSNTLHPIKAARSISNQFEANDNWIFFP